MGNIRHKTQKNRHDYNWTQETERETRVTLDTRHRKLDTVSMDSRHRKLDMGSIEHKTHKDRHGYHWTQDTER